MCVRARESRREEVRTQAQCRQIEVQQRGRVRILLGLLDHLQEADETVLIVDGRRGQTVGIVARRVRCLL